MPLKINVRFLTENTDHEILVEPDFTVHQLKELLRQQIPFFTCFSSIPTEVLKLSLEGFDGEGELTGNVMEDGRPLSAYPLTEERHPVLLALERPVEKICCPGCHGDYVQWSGDRLCCGDVNEEGDKEMLEKRKSRIPQLLNCGHSVCLECWREGLVAAEEAMAEEKEFVVVDPSLLTEEEAAAQNRVALEKAAENAQKQREREKAENVWKFVCCEKSCGMVTYWRKDQERSCHGGMQRLVHLKKREWVEAERARGRCSIKACGAEAMFYCPDCDLKHCIIHFNRIHQFEDMSDHVPRVLLSSQVHPSISDIFKTRFCCYCGDGETSSCMGARRPHCEHEDHSLTHMKEMTRAIVMEQLSTLGSLQADCWGQLISFNTVMEQLKENRVNGEERIRKEFDNLILRLEAWKEDMVEELRCRYREKEMELVGKMEALGVLSGELEAGLVHHRQSLAEFIQVTGTGAEMFVVVRDVVEINALREKVTQLASEASPESLERFVKISMEFACSETQQVVVDFRIEPLSNLQHNRPKLSKELEQNVAVLSQELNVATTALNASTDEEAAVQVDLQANTSTELNVGKTDQTVHATTAASTVNSIILALTPSKSSEMTPQQLCVANEQALLEAAGKGALEVVKHLTTNGVNVNCQNYDGWTPLHMSATVEVMEYLVQKGADIHCKSKDGRTSAHISAGNGQLEAVKYLLEQGADIHCRSNNGRTLLHSSASEDRLEVVKYLLLHGADIHCRDKFDWTPLHWSVHQGNLEVVKYLLQQGADIHCKDKDDWTPLHWSVHRRKIEVANYLLQQGADINVKDKWGKTPYDVAVAANNLNRHLLASLKDLLHGD